MKHAKSTGAVVVSLILAFVMLGIYAAGAITLGVTAYKTKNGVAQDVVNVENEDDYASDFGDSWLETEADAVMETYASYVTLDCVAEDGGVRGVVTGHYADGGTWEYTTPVIETTQIEPIQEIAAYEDVYIFNVGGMVTALDTRTGDELWCNTDFGGQGIAFAIDADRTMYLSGYYGPDLCIIDIHGNTLAYVERFQEGFSKPCEVVFDEQFAKVMINYEEGPVGESASILYNIGDGTFYVFDTEMTLASEMETWQSSFMALKMDDKLRDKYMTYALVHIDDDGVPEMIGRGQDCHVVLWHDRSRNETHILEFTGSGYVEYFPGTGILANVRVDYMDSGNEYTTVYYRVTENGFENLGEFWYKGVKDENDKYQYEYKHNGTAVDGTGYYDAKSVIDEQCSMVSGVTPAMYNAQENDTRILSWYDPSDDLAVFKEMANEELQYRTTGDGYKLIDLNGDGVQEIFIYEHKEYGDYGYVFVFDVQTRQTYVCYTTIDEVGRTIGENVLFDTNEISSTIATDSLYEVENYRIVTKQKGNRYMYSETNTECYLGDEKVSVEEYVEAFSVLLDGVEYLAEGCVSYDEIMKQLQ